MKPGADLGLSRGGADFQKIFEIFVDLFFPALPKHCFVTDLAKIWVGSGSNP